MLVVAGGLAVLLWYYKRRPVEVTVTLVFPERRGSIRSVAVTFLRDGQEEASIRLTELDPAPAKLVRKIKLNRALYKLRTRVVYLDGRRRKSETRLRVKGTSTLKLEIR